ncbi:MAG: hypothetical protein A4E42_00332 [Methanoregulaceae archaeon PtaU1.Bin222]|nr:MAG: hypothetical protein A4E42_00332 [Methanoregulaceae archaeon PtaU1.Bin222]
MRDLLFEWDRRGSLRVKEDDIDPWRTAHDPVDWRDKDIQAAGLAKHDRGHIVLAGISDDLVGDILSSVDHDLPS